MEKQENRVGACSGCAGDHEDPDFSAWEPDVEEDEEVNRGGERAGRGGGEEG